MGNVDVPTITCHGDATKMGVGASHVDINHWFPKYGKSMVDARADVTKLLGMAPAQPEKPDTPDTPKDDAELSYDDIKVGDILNFTGNLHYTSANAKTGKKATPNRVKVLSKYLKSSKHPIHARAIDENGKYKSGVYGWIDISDISAISEPEPTPVPVPTPTPTPVKKPDVIYQVYAGGKWWGEITNYNETNSNGYAGVFGKEISGIRVKLSNGEKVTVRSHISGNAKNNWLSEITKWDNTSNGYSGWKGKPTDCIVMKADGCTLKYRVHTKDGKWLNWISKYDINDYNKGLAGIYGKSIDAVQITVV